MNPRRVVDRVLFLRSHPAFADLSVPVLLTFARRCTSAQIESGTVVPVAGSAELESVLFVTSGGLEVERPSGVEIVGEGEIAGLLHVFSGRPPPVIRASADTQAFGITREDIEELLEQSFEFVTAMLRWVCDQTLSRLDSLPSGHALPGTRETQRERTVGGSFTRRLAALAGSSWFPGEHLDALAELAVHVTDASFPEGDPLWQAGDEAAHFYVVTRGSVRCEEGSWYCQGGEGVTMGEFEALARQPRRFRAIAVDEVHALRIEIDPFLDILEDHPQLATAVLSILSERCLFLTTETLAATDR